MSHLPPPSNGPPGGWGAPAPAFGSAAPMQTAHSLHHIPPPTNTPPGGGGARPPLERKATHSAYEAAAPAAGDDGAPQDDTLTWNSMKNYYVNDGPKAIWIGIFLLANIAVFTERFLFYANSNAALQQALFGAFGWGLPLARGAAAAIKLDCALLLFTVMRNFLSWMRTTVLCKFIPLDKNIVFHKGIAWTLLFFVLVHMLSHHVNYYRLSQVKREALVALTGADLPDPQDPNEDLITAWGFAYKTIPGITGHMIVFIMVLMYSSAIATIRRPQFEVFWYTHHLFVAFYFLLAIHGYPGVLEPPNALFWVIGPFIFYSIERLMRYCKGNEDTVLVMAVMHPGGVMELRMKKNTFDYEAGMYLFLNCPALSSQEWHPFTITSAPEQDFVSVHIRIVGDWTTALKELLNPNDELGIVCESIATAPDGRPILRIDGPFGTASEEVFHHKTVKLVAGGIGVTPFASILRSVRYRSERQRATGIQQIPIEKVYFYWLSRDATAFEWFSELLCALEDADEHGLLEIHIYCTSRTIDKKKLADKSAQTGRDGLTGLRSLTTFGRPKWPEIFDKAVADHPGETIGVFFCGPAVVSKALYKTSREKTFQYSSQGNKFVYLKENF